MNTSFENLRRDLGALALLALLVALFFWRILTPNPADRAQFPPGDFSDQFYAFRLYEARAFAAGRLPLWSEHFNSGHPFLADVQAAVFYPIALANTLLNVALFGANFSLFALELEALLHFWLAGAFMYLFARRVIQSRVGAFTAAVVFTFGGYLTSYPSLQLAILETAAWLPLALYFLDRAMTETNRRFVSMDFVYAGIVLGVAALAGHPQTFLFVLALCVVYFVFRLGATTRVAPTLRGSVLLFGLTLSLAFGVAAAQIIPSLEYQRLSVRAAWSFRQAAAGFPTLDVLQFILPGFVSAFASPLYIGILPLWLAVFAFLQRGRDRVFWGFVALGALLLACGFYVFAYVVIYLLVPGVTLFRQQERLAFVVSFALALLAGFGLRDLSAGVRSQLARKLFPLLPGGAALALALLVTFFAAGVQQPSGRSAFLGDRAGLVLLLFALAALLVGAHVRGWLAPRALTPLALALILFDLFSVNEPANKAQPGERYIANPLAAIVQRDEEISRVADEGQMPGHFGIGYRFEEIGGISPLRLAHYDQLLDLAPEKLWRLLGVKYVFSARPGFADAASAALLGETRLLRLNNTLPRAWLVGAALVESDDARAVALMATNDFDPRQLAVLASLAPFALDPRAAQGTAAIAARAPERLTIDVDAPADGLLIVSENFYPGWEARVNGAPVEILRADVSLRAVPLRAGAQRVEMLYDPLSVKLGLAVSLVTLLLSVFALRMIRRHAL